MDAPLAIFVGLIALAVGCLLCAFMLGALAYMNVSEKTVMKDAGWYNPNSRISLLRALKVNDQWRKPAATGVLVMLAAVVGTFVFGYWMVFLPFIVVGGAVAFWWVINHGMATGVDKAGGLR